VLWAPLNTFLFWVVPRKEKKKKRVGKRGNVRSPDPSVMFSIVEPGGKKGLERKEVFRPYSLRHRD